MSNRRTGAVTIAALGIVALTGCYVPRPRDAKGVNADAIEAANCVDLESERLPLLKGIAKRRNLTQPEQIYLVDSICHAGFGGEQGPAMIGTSCPPIEKPSNGKTEFSGWN